MKILGLDLGTKTCGIALSDYSKTLASGIETFRFKENNYKECLRYLEKYIEEYKITEVVLGYPKNMNNTVGESGQRSERFKQSLQDKYNVNVILWDERLTTRVVTNVLIDANVSRKKRRDNVDKMAATLILQSYLDNKENKNER